MLAADALGGLADDAVPAVLLAFRSLAGVILSGATIAGRGGGSVLTGLALAQVGQQAALDDDLALLAARGRGVSVNSSPLLDLRR